MTATTYPLDQRWRIARWAAAAALLCVPAIAMRYTAEVDWTASDFVVMGVLLAAVLLGYEVLASRAGSLAYRAAAALTVLGVFLVIWVNLAVGIVGNEDNPWNILFALPIATVVGGTIIVRARAAGMVRVLLFGAAELALIVLAGVYVQHGEADPAIVPRVLGGCGVFVAIWLTAAALFARAAR